MAILACLERLNDKATQRVAGEDLAAMVRVRGARSGSSNPRAPRPLPARVLRPPPRQSRAWMREA